MELNLLDDVTICDFTTRLPGPMSTFILRSLGAKIIKVENSAIGGDAFQNSDYLTHAPHFKDWYDNLNQEKEIYQIDFSKEITKLSSFIEKSQIIIVPESKFFKTFLEKFNLDNKAIVKLSGGKGEWKSLHDLNALALTKTFNSHLKDTQAPPYLPFAGISFAQFIATASLALLRKAERTKQSITQTLYLKDITTHILDSLYSEQVSSPNKFLHNGAFPCYQVYLSQDQKYVCVAAVEEKYWNNLQKAFNLQFEPEDRFDLSNKTTKTLKKLFSKLNSNEISTQIKNIETCITIIEN